MLKNRLLMLARMGLIHLDQPAGDSAGGSAQDTSANNAAQQQQAASTTPVFQAPQPIPAANQQANTASAQQQTQQQTTDNNGLPTDVEALQKMVADLRKENAAARVNGKQTAAEEARKELAQQLGKALGLVEDDTAPTPEQLTAQLTASQEAARTSAVELAVYKTTQQHGGNPAALTDSRAFLAKVADLDPTAEDFTTKVIEAAKKAVSENPTLKAAQAAGQSTIDNPGGSGDRPKQPASLGAAVDSAYASASK